jgi:hypothetical protein
MDLAQSDEDDKEEEEEENGEDGSTPTGADSKDTKNPAVLPQTTAPAGIKVKGPKLLLSALAAGYRETDMEQQQERSTRLQEKFKRLEVLSAEVQVPPYSKKKKLAKSKKDTSTAVGAVEEECKIGGEDRSNNKSQQQQEAQQQGLMPGSAGPG